MKRIPNRLFLLLESVRAQKRPLVLGTHDGPFHQDESLAVAMFWKLAQMTNTKVKPVRSRDTLVLEKCDIVFDVGGKYSIKDNWYDHHQPEHVGSRPNGIDFSAIGLVWMEFGEEFCLAIIKRYLPEEAWDEAIHAIPWIAQKVDQDFICGACASDNGQAVVTSTPKVMTLSASVSKANQNWLCEERIGDQQEEDLMEIVVPYLALQLRNQVIDAAENIYSRPRVARMIKKVGKNFPLLILPNRTRSWGSLIKEQPDIMFVIQPSKSKKRSWTVIAVKEGGGYRMRMPQKWGGLSQSELEKVTKIEGVKYVHPKGFLASTETQEAGQEIALKIIEMYMDGELTR